MPRLVRLLSSSRPAARGIAPSSAAAIASNAAAFAPLAALARSLCARLPDTNLAFLVGGPGSGKGTLSAMLDARLGRPHVSVGELLRREAARDTPLAADIAAVLARGGIAPSSVAIRLLLEHLARQDSTGGTCVVDGFPRKLRNAQVWEGLGLGVATVVALEVAEDTMRDRLSKRGRTDDEPQIVAKRMEEHRREWQPIVHFYRQRGLLTLVDANGGAEETWQRFSDVMPDALARA